MASIMEDKNDNCNFEMYGISAKEDKITTDDKGAIFSNKKNVFDGNNICLEEDSGMEVSVGGDSPEKIVTSKWIISDIYLKNQENSPNNFIV